jgi:hypothetical protein
MKGHEKIEETVEEQELKKILHRILNGSETLIKLGSAVPERAV